LKSSHLKKYECINTCCETEINILMKTLFLSTRIFLSLFYKSCNDKRHVNIVSEVLEIATLDEFQLHAQH
ncbi:27232_t:CDS:2, partial [Racocetra persica]